METECPRILDLANKDFKMAAIINMFKELKKAMFKKLNKSDINELTIRKDHLFLERTK